MPKAQSMSPWRLHDAHRDAQVSLFFSFLGPKTGPSRAAPRRPRPRAVCTEDSPEPKPLTSTASARTSRPLATRHTDTGGATESRRGSRSTDRRRAGVAQPAELAIWILRLYPTRLVQLFGDSLNSLTELLSRLCVCLILFSKFPLFP